MAADKTHVVLDENGEIVLFADEDACIGAVGDQNVRIDSQMENDEAEEGAADDDHWTYLPAAIWVGEFSPVQGESVGIYRHLSGGYLFGIDGSWLETECDDGVVTDPINGGSVFLLDSMDPNPDGTAKV